MKALALIVLGFLITAGSGYGFLAARATDGPVMASLAFVGIIAGIVIGLYGLVANHREHTRR